MGGSHQTTSMEDLTTEEHAQHGSTPAGVVAADETGRNSLALGLKEKDFAWGLRPPLRWRGGCPLAAGFAPATDRPANTPHHAQDRQQRGRRLTAIHPRHPRIMLLLIKKTGHELHAST